MGLVTKPVSWLLCYSWFILYWPFSEHIDCLTGSFWTKIFVFRYWAYSFQIHLRVLNLIIPIFHLAVLRNKTLLGLADINVGQISVSSEAAAIYRFRMMLYDLHWYRCRMFAFSVHCIPLPILTILPVWWECISHLIVLIASDNETGLSIVSFSTACSYCTQDRHIKLHSSIFFSFIFSKGNCLSFWFCLLRKLKQISVLKYKNSCPDLMIGFIQLSVIGTSSQHSSRWSIT